jgi:hypothetical protein
MNSKNLPNNFFFQKRRNFQRTCFRKQMCSLTFSKNVSWRFLHYMKNWVRHFYKCTWVLLLYLFRFSTNLNFLDSLLEVPNLKLSENLSSGSRVDPCVKTVRRIDRRDEANSSNVPKKRQLTSTCWTEFEPNFQIFDPYVHSFCSLSYDRYVASSKARSPLTAI